MSVSSRKEIRDSVLKTTRQSNAQIGDFVNDCINLTINEINDPAWAFPRKNYNHKWSWLRRKTSFDTVDGTTDYVLGRDIDTVALMRQTQTPTKIRQVSDERFFNFIPNPTATGNPKIYRLWEQDGVSTRLATADTIDVVSSSASDAGSAELAVTVWGYVGGVWQPETYTLNGVTDVTGSLTFQAREILVSKQRDTTGTITVSENSGGTALTTLAPQERSARFKVASLYPQPGSAMTVDVEYYTFIHQLESDSDVPEFHQKWHYVVRLGTLSKIYQYLNKETDFVGSQALYASGVRAMVASDRVNPDLIERLAPRLNRVPNVHIRRTQDAIA